MPLRKSQKGADLKVVWELVSDRDAEQRLLQAFELLLCAPNDPQRPVDKSPQTSQDVDIEKYL